MLRVRLRLRVTLLRMREARTEIRIVRPSLSIAYIFIIYDINFKKCMNHTITVVQIV